MSDALPGSLRGESVLERGGGDLDSRRELLADCSGHETTNDVARHNAAHPSLRFLEGCQTTQLDRIYNVIWDCGPCQILCEPPETKRVDNTVQERPQTVRGQARWACNGASSGHTNVLRE